MSTPFFTIFPIYSAKSSHLPDRKLNDVVSKKSKIGLRRATRLIISSKCLNIIAWVQTGEEGGGTRTQKVNYCQQIYLLPVFPWKLESSQKVE